MYLDSGQCLSHVLNSRQFRTLWTEAILWTTLTFNEASLFPCIWTIVGERLRNYPQHANALFCPFTGRAKFQASPVPDTRDR